MLRGADPGAEDEKLWPGVSRYQNIYIIGYCSYDAQHAGCFRYWSLNG